MKQDLNYYISIVHEEYKERYYKECKERFTDEAKYPLINFMRKFDREIENKAIILFERNNIRENIINELEKKYHENGGYTDFEGIKYSLDEFIEVKSFGIERDITYLYTQKEVSNILIGFFGDCSSELYKVMQDETMRLLELRKKNDDTFRSLWELHTQGKHINNFTDDEGNRLWRVEDVFQYYESKVIDNFISNPLFLPFLIEWQMTIK